MHKSFTLVVLALLLLSGDIIGQITISPYSRYGVGDLYSPSSTRNFTMGGIGIGTFDASTVNRINPASYADLATTTINLSGFGQISQQKSELNTAVLNTAGFHSLALGFANNKGFGLTAGLAPYSSTGYKVVTSDSVLTDSVFEHYTTTYSASGGLSQVYLGAGFRFLRNFRAGVNLTFVFGNNFNNWVNDFENTSYANVNIEKRVTVTGFAPQFGLQYGDTLHINRIVKRIGVIEDDEKEIKKRMALLDKEEKKMEKDHAKLLTWEMQEQGKIEDFETEKSGIDHRVEQLMANEKENEKEIGKLQERAFRIEKKRKKYVREVKNRTRELSDIRSRINRRRKKFQARLDTYAQERTQIEAGEKSNETERKRDYMFRLGMVSELGGKLTGERLLHFDNTAVADTLSFEDGFIKLPSKIGFGFQFSRPHKWTLGFDASFQSWNNFEFFNETNTLQNSMNLNLGGEWIPDLISRKYGQRIAWRGGAYLKNTAVVFNGNPVQEYGVTFGMGLPIGRFNRISKNYARVNLGFSLGKRGNLSENPLEEMNVQMRVGINLGERWFVRRRID